MTPQIPQPSNNAEQASLEERIFQAINLTKKAYKITNEKNRFSH